MQIVVMKQVQKPHGIHSPYVLIHMCNPSGKLFAWNVDMENHHLQKIA